ncbi:DUF1194 domain-containing protein [Hoeflea poritis]|uniref:DUF1194 domain-containing protein n=1 Tax=Hoeflea poritis TaxID=2993659 RepID=A0ABT4VHU7_9HYPH|nr:DUF1194 domain-containing protein [Hoeflea poritis]MDA4844287.1 DUF1194 domain-containing protein [Hoeflea poritis]
MKRTDIPAALALALFLWAAPLSDITAQTTGTMEVDVELVLAVDVSRSMTERELQIQRRGYAEALNSEAVATAIKNGLIGRIALTYVEWGGAFWQRVVVDWRVIENEADLAAFAQEITANFDGVLRRTSISSAITYAADSIDTNNFEALRRVIDISGDGPNNEGGPVTGARDAALARGMIINGLPLMTREGMGARFHLEDLDDYYHNCVIGGPGSFVIPVTDWDEFPEAVRRKLVLELAGTEVMPVHKAQYTGLTDAGYDCLIGEKIWQRFIGP